MSDDRVPGADILQGRRRPVMLSSSARDSVSKLGARAKPLLARLERLAAGASEDGPLIQGSLGKQGYKYMTIGDLRTVYREITPAELMNQGYKEYLTRRGGIFVVDIFSTRDST
ncbi:hypothetical protein GCM10017708_04820 [Arthrobacter citreus]